MKSKTIKFYRENFKNGVNFRKALRDYHRIFRGKRP